jgi:predicted esterase
MWSGRFSGGDHTLSVDVFVARNRLTTYTSGVSVVQDLSRRLDRLNGMPAPSSLDGRTFRSLVTLLRRLADGWPPETIYPAARLLGEAEELAVSIAAGREYYGPQRTGQFWLSVPTGNTTTPVRLFVPDAAKAGKPMPLVVALHGAGGSENLFFDAYGNGLVARLAQERGWMVVAPRAGWLFDAAPPAAAIVDELAKVYPIDKQRVFIVGHSMGAMQAVTLAQETPGRFAAIAVLGGGGAVEKPAVVKDLPVFIGCGKGDFLLGGARGLAEQLKKAGATRLIYKEYPGVEHMLVVQEALPEVFRFFAASR